MIYLDTPHAIGLFRLGWSPFGLSLTELLGMFCNAWFYFYKMLFFTISLLMYNAHSFLFLQNNYLSKHAHSFYVNFCKIIIYVKNICPTYVSQT
jgi:hypothetical protein